MGGFVRYGIVKNDFIVIKVSPRSAFVRSRRSLTRLSSRVPAPVSRSVSSPSASPSSPTPPAALSRRSPSSSSILLPSSCVPFPPSLFDSSRSLTFFSAIGSRSFPNRCREAPVRGTEEDQGLGSRDRFDEEGECRGLQVMTMPCRALVEISSWCCPCRRGAIRERLGRGARECPSCSPFSLFSLRSSSLSRLGSPLEGKLLKAILHGSSSPRRGEDSPSRSAAFPRSAPTASPNANALLCTSSRYPIYPLWSPTCPTPTSYALSLPLARPRADLLRLSQPTTKDASTTSLLNPVRLPPSLSAPI